jgi:hypothetical protein
MMMKMLAAGGLPVLTDGIRQADEDNPEGYYEFERVKALPKGDHAWLAEAQGKAVKVIAALLEYLPPGYTYRVIFMHRRMEEILASQRKMLQRRGEDADKVSDEEMARLFEKHLQRVRAWLAARPDVAVLDVDYNRLLADPRPYAEQVNYFLGGGLDVDRMVEVVNPDLYRNRARQGKPEEEGLNYTTKVADMPTWEQDLENTPECAGQQQDEERIIEQLRALGYM